VWTKFTFMLGQPSADITRLILSTHSCMFVVILQGIVRALDRFIRVYAWTLQG
jgi:hypothetical protein